MDGVALCAAQHNAALIVMHSAHRFGPAGFRSTASKAEQARAVSQGAS